MINLRIFSLYLSYTKQLAHVRERERVRVRVANQIIQIDINGVCILVEIIRMNAHFVSR